MPQEGASAARCNLIVAPLSVLASWILQIQKFVQPGFLKVAEYRGPNREIVLRQVKRGAVDILLVSYETLTSDYKAHQAMLEEKEEDEAERDAQQAKKPKKKAKRSQLADAWSKKKRRSKSNNMDDSDSEDDAFDPDEEDSEDDDDHYLPAAMTRKRPAKKQPSTWIFDIPFHRIILDEGTCGSRNNAFVLPFLPFLLAESSIQRRTPLTFSHLSAHIFQRTRFAIPGRVVSRLSWESKP